MSRWHSFIISHQSFNAKNKFSISWKVIAHTAFCKVFCWPIFICTCSSRLCLTIVTDLPKYSILAKNDDKGTYFKSKTVNYSYLSFKWFQALFCFHVYLSNLIIPKNQQNIGRIAEIGLIQTAISAPMNRKARPAFNRCFTLLSLLAAEEQLIQIYLSDCEWKQNKLYI